MAAQKPIKMQYLCHLWVNPIMIDEKINVMMGALSEQRIFLKIQNGRQ